jgi:hypothetical protein
MSINKVGKLYFHIGILKSWVPACLRTHSAAELLDWLTFKQSQHRVD